MKFIKYFFAALLALFVWGILSSLIWIAVIAGIASSSDSAITIEPNTILKIDLAENIVDSPSSNPFSGFDFMTMELSQPLSLLKATQAIDAAAEDDRIKGIYINPNGMGTASSAALEELRQAIVDFKSTGKFVVAYSDGYEQGSYYLASAADKIFLQKEGMISWQGLSYNLPFFKGLFDKLGIEYEIIRPTACKYKSAVEPYFMTKMSDANREQNQVMINSMWTTIASAVVEARGFESLEQFNRLTDDLQLSMPEDALKNGMVDGLIYEDEMNEYFAQMGMERNSENEFNMVSLGEYSMQLMPNIDTIGEKQVAIVYADGAIVDGTGEEEDTVYGNSLAELIKEVRLDENIAAVVLRVNSPGGSALASDVIWREVSLLQAEKPVVVSMGAYAASGGYYISAPADAIIANNTTLTGSIGVFGAFPIVGKALEEKVGITFDCVKSNKHSDFGQGFIAGAIRPTAPAEKALLMKRVDKVYESFTGKVAEGRNLSRERVYEIAAGRVWTGADAKQIGLVDDIGGLKYAIAVAADKAGLEKYQVVEHLSAAEGFAALFSGLNAAIKSRYEADALGLALEPYKQAREMMRFEGVMMYSVLPKF